MDGPEVDGIGQFHVVYAIGGHLVLCSEQSRLKTKQYKNVAQPK